MSLPMAAKGALQSLGVVISLALCMYHVGSHIEQYPAFPFFGFHQRQWWSPVVPRSPVERREIRRMRRVRGERN